MTSGDYKIFGIEMSPYSVKIRSYFRYKGIPHQWIIRNADTLETFQKYARLPIIPLLVTPQEQGVQDSTPIIEMIEQRYPEPTIHPSDSVAGFVSSLLEEFGDEWGNKWMFHLRWAREVDQISSARRIAGSMIPFGSEKEATNKRAAEKDIDELAQQIRARMVDRVWFVGSNEQNAPLIESSFRGALTDLEKHLACRPYLFGGRPAFGDFGLWGQIYEAWTDPTGAAYIEGNCPKVLDWVHRMLWPTILGEFEDWASLEPTLMPLLSQQLGGLFMPWTQANVKAIENEDKEFTVQLNGASWSQIPQKYHAKSLKALRAKYQGVANKTDLDVVLEKAGCLQALLA